MLACPRCGSSYSKDQEFCGIDGERLQEQATDPMIGRTIDRYTVTAPLGEGGMARVYRARHTFLEQDFAVKILFGDLASDKNVAKRFQREAQAASKLKHPNVVSTIDMGQAKEGLIFMAMELLEGRTLTEVIRAEGAMPPARAAFMVKQIAAGLGAAHALGYVHRDLKPKNIMIVGADEVLKILDFGLVLLTESSGPQEAAKITDATHLTQQGQVFGTPAYMAPEQCSSSAVGPAADLYSLGVILYQLLAGSVPFGGQPAQIALHHLSSPPPPLADFSGLGPIAMRLLAKKPEERFASAAEVIAAVEAIDFAAPAATPAATWTATPSTPAAPAWAPAKREEEALSFAGEISLISERSADFDERQNEAIVRSWRAGWFGLLGVLVLLFGLAYAAFGDRVERALVAEKQEEPPPPPPVSPPPAVKPKLEEPPDPPPQVVKHEEPLPPPPVELEEPPPAPKHEPPPAPKHEPPKYEPPPPVEHEPLPDDSPPAERRAFEQRDLSIGYKLSERGLNWRDLAGASPEAATTWTLWRNGIDHPTVRELEVRGAELEAAVARIFIDTRLLDAKLERARKILGDLPDGKKDTRYAALVTRYNAIRSRALRARNDDVKERLAAEITLLETDAQLHAASADNEEGTISSTAATHL